MKKKLLEKEKESQNFINRYTLKIKKIFQEQIQKNIPKINSNNKIQNNIIKSLKIKMYFTLLYK